jgi:hypothetical protein
LGSLELVASAAVERQPGNVVRGARLETEERAEH